MHNKEWLDKEDIICEYTSGTSLKKLEKKYKHNKLTLNKKLKEWGIKLRTKYEANQKYYFDKSFFEKIDTHEKAYWLGFIYADGNVYQGKDTWKKVLQVCLAVKDENHLVKFKNSIKSEHKIYNDKHQKRFMINSAELFNLLNKLGVYPNKSLELKFPSKEQVPKEFIPSFILGYFDGDGSISCDFIKNKWRFQIIGTYDILDKILEYLQECGINRTGLTLDKKRGNNKLYYVSFSGSIKYKNNNISKRKYNLFKIYDYLYKQSTMWMDRKKKSFDLAIKKAHE